MSCCPCFPSKKKYAKKLKEEGVKNNNKKKYKQKKGGQNVEMPAIAHTTDVHMDRTEEEKQKDVDAFRSMFKSKNTTKKTNVGKDENSSASIRSINVEEKKNSINDNRIITYFLRYWITYFYKSNLQDSKLRAWIFLAPALIILFIFLIYPVVETTRLSFLDNHGREFKGINNYIWAINDSDFRQSILNNFL